MALRSRWSTHHDPATGDVVCHDDETKETLWGDPSQCWVPCIGGGMRNTLTKETVVYAGVEGRFYGAWHPCTIRKENDNGTVDVVWTGDETGTAGLPPTDIRNPKLQAQAHRGSHWVEHVCFTHARSFYKHKVSNVRQWDMPEDLLLWRRYLLAWRPCEVDEVEMFYNLISGETSPSPPPGWYRYVDQLARARRNGEWHACTVWRVRHDGACDVRWTGGCAAQLPASSVKFTQRDRTPIHDEYDSWWAGCVADIACDRFRILGLSRAPVVPHRRGPLTPSALVLDPHPPPLPPAYDTVRKRRPPRKRSAAHWLDGFAGQC
eukprot:TRINITY_DN7343_c0_g2_i2.p1 TRINITY_DN7343_c0_g2~~TRINITY_DN7343_c0_g2_i2.p1  ORF type:complete len:320 (+),score=30.08 TRINITY_DN7343_c0_g2_i2:125-1084(+)